MRRTTLLCLALLIGAATSTACSTAGDSAARHRNGPLRVVAAENFWGSIAAQLGGTHVQVHSIISNPNTDPHDYEATASDSRAIADADLVIVNGIGYDPWATKAVAASQSTQRATLDVGRVTGHRAGDNPHRWYYPVDVAKVIDQITADYSRLDPTHATYYAELRTHFNQVSLRPYHRLIGDLARRFSGTPVGASESIFDGITQATHLDLITPAGFLDSVTEGTDVTAGNKATVDAQVANHKIVVFLFNIQNATPDVQRLVSSAKHQGIPVVEMTETLTPAGATFQQWQVSQLRKLEAALDEATGR